MSKDAVVLVVDDEREHADGMAEALRKSFARALAVYTGADALEIVRSQDIDIIVTDLKLGGEIDGLDILREAKKLGQNEVILITAYATIDTCKEAIKQGAYDYLVKPINIDQLRALVEQAARHLASTKQTSMRRQPAADEEFRFDGIRGGNSQMAGIFEVLRRVAPTNISVLIQGQSGTGKELLARAIHANSNRWNKPFRPINCAGFTETLLESELFGHVKGSFTGAAADRKGLFEIADKGTLFLDEIGDMPLNMQAKLLRVIEDGVVIPVGGNKPIVVDVRIISATNHDLAGLVEEKKFREDLYFRIKGVSVSIPALRERQDDIPILADFFLKEAVAETGSKVKGITRRENRSSDNVSEAGPARNNVSGKRRSWISRAFMGKQQTELRTLLRRSCGGPGASTSELSQRGIVKAEPADVLYDIVQRSRGRPGTVRKVRFRRPET